VIEHYYSAQSRRTVSDDAWAATPAIVKEALVGPTADRGVADMAKAARDGGFDRRDAHLSTTRMKLDEAGWKEAAEVLLKAYRDLETIEVAARKRLGEDPRAKPVSAESVISLFEVGTAADPAG
jgi:hypothetical protein